MMQIENLKCRIAVIGIVAAILALATQQARAWPARVFAPYVDFTAWPPYDLLGAGTNASLRYATLAFVVADSSQNPSNAPATNIPAWGGYTAYSTASGYRLADINSFRALGGDVIVSFGGASGTELAAYITDTNRLKLAYQSVIDRYAATWVDFDIEGTWVADPVSINRRSLVLAALQADAVAGGRLLQVSLTLPVLPTGLDNNGMNVLRSAISNHVDLACVNVMAMDYGDGAAPNPSGRMGDYAIAAATNLFNQLKASYQAAGIPKTDPQLWKMVGVTPMLGVNDVATEVFDQAAAAQLVSYATNRDLGLLAFWSMNRDRPGQSGITQTPYQFTSIFLGFSGAATGAIPSLSVADASVREGNSGTTNLTFTVTLWPAATNTVSAAYATTNGSATAPTDYFATNATLTFAPGQTSATITVVVVGDTNVEPDETFYLNLTNPTNATLARSQAVGTILNDDTGSTGGGSTGECAITTQWLVTYDSGAFRATQTLSNPNATNITLAAFEFDAPYTSVDWIGAGSDANWVTPAHSGTHFTVANGWPTPAVIPAGGTLQLLYQAAPGGNPPAPSSLIINGVHLADCGGPPLFTGVQRQGSNLVLTWTTTAGKTNHILTSPNISLPLAQWSDVSGPLVAPGSGTVTASWTQFGGATNGPTDFYRVKRDL
jgi:hypothetical protein